MQSHGMPHRFAALTQLTVGLAIENPSVPHQDVAESRMESHVFGLAMVMPTANVLPWNELFPADSQR